MSGPVEPSTAGRAEDGAEFDRFYAIVLSFQNAAPLPGGNGVLVAPLLVAMTHFLRIFDALALGDIAQVIKNDVSGNVQKLGNAASLHRTDTVAALLTAEMADPADEALIRKGAGRGRDSGAIALLWIKRVVQFVSSLVRVLLDKPEVTLADASRQAYASTLSLCHNFILRGVFDTGLRFAPARSVFYENIAGRGNTGTVDGGLRDFLVAADSVFAPIVELYRSNRLEQTI
jgi:Glycolipid transfer protein (GLTP)